MQFRNIAAAASAAIAIFAAGSAGAVTQLQFDTAGDSGQIYFNGLVPGTDDTYAGLGSTFVLTLASITDGGYRWNFTYELANVSTVDSRLSVVGWDWDAENVTVSDLSGLFDHSASGNMSFGGSKDLCLKATGGASCSGGAGAGLADGASGSGAFSLEFADWTVGGTKHHPTYIPLAAPTSLTFDDFAVRYQSVPGISSTIGVPDVAPPTPDPQMGVPEPDTWAMLILGFFGMGLVVRQRRRLLRA